MIIFPQRFGMDSSDMIATQERPRQVVILAGGRGTRLAPLTDTRPKPMVEFHGRPFLEYLIALLREQGFERVVLLLGYLPDVVRDHFGDGSDFGVEITYCVTPPEDETGRRVRQALPHLDPVFMLMYCDNYWPMPFDRMWQRYCEAGAPAMVTIYRNGDGYTRNNLRIGADGFLEVYDKSRTSEGLSGVDIGFLILRREIVERLPEGNVSFEATLYPNLVARHELVAFPTDHRYYSVGDHKRLPLTEAFLAAEPAVILDRDGVLNKKMPRAEYVRSWADWQWIEGSLEAIVRLSEKGIRVIIVTNQAGIARGVMSEDDLAAIHGEMVDQVEAAGGRVAGIYHCPHGWDDDCACRKPKPGMLYQAQRDFYLDLSRTYFMGDDDRDGEAALAADCPFEKISEERPLSLIVDSMFETVGK